MLRINLGPSSLDTKYMQLETWIAEFFNKTRNRCEEAIGGVKVSDIIADEDPWDYLNLESRHTIGRNWWRKVLKQIAQEMPQECKEFFMAEKEFWTLGITGTLYLDMTELYLEDIESYHANFRSFYLPFETVFFRRIEQVEDRALKAEKIRRFLNIYKLCSPERLYIFESLLGLCTNPPLSSDLTMEVIQTIFKRSTDRRFLFQLVPDESSLEVMLWHAKQAKFDFWGLWRGRGGMSYDLNPVVDYISSEYRNSFARTLLKYGFRYTPQRIVCIKQFQKFLVYRYQSIIIGKLDGLSHLLKSHNLLRTMLMVDTFNTFVDPEGYEDIFDKTITLVHLTRSLPEPYVTPKELYETLRPTVVHSFRDDLKKICDEYNEAAAFEDDYSFLQPRCLKHLCRCKVRDALADNVMLPEGIGKLNLPLTVEMYLELKF